MSAQRPMSGRPATWNWWLRSVMADFYMARDLRAERRDTYSKGYPTEAAEFDEVHPPYRLGDFLIDHSYRHLIDEAVVA